MPVISRYPNATSPRGPVVYPLFYGAAGKAHPMSTEKRDARKGDLGGWYLQWVYALTEAHEVNCNSVLTPLRLAAPRHWWRELCNAPHAAALPIFLLLWVVGSISPFLVVSTHAPARVLLLAVSFCGMIGRGSLRRRKAYWWLCKCRLQISTLILRHRGRIRQARTDIRSRLVDAGKRYSRLLYPLARASSRGGSCRGAVASGNDIPKQMLQSDDARAVALRMGSCD